MGCDATNSSASSGIAAGSAACAAHKRTGRGGPQTWRRTSAAPIRTAQTVGLLDSIGKPREDDLTR